LEPADRKQIRGGAERQIDVIAPSEAWVVNTIHCPLTSSASLDIESYRYDSDVAVQQAPPRVPVIITRYHILQSARSPGFREHGSARELPAARDP